MLSNPITPPTDRPTKSLRPSDFRAIAQLAVQATDGVTRITEGVHQSVLGTMGIPAGNSPEQTRSITGLVYRNVRNITQLVGRSLDTLLAALQPLLDPAEDALPDSPQREALLAVLNGVMGDRLVASNNSFAIPMTIRYKNEALNWASMPPMPEATGKIMLLVHGLCMNDLWRHTQYKGHELDHGDSLASTLGHTPVYLHYNSGLHTSLNGRELSAQLEQLVRHWPTPVEELSVVAYSMGGLLTRSAFHYAKEENLQWPSRLKNIVFLGTPHHGTSLEQLGNWLDAFVGSMPFTRPFTRLAQLRSAGITDLRYGHVLDEDWYGHDRFHRRPDSRQMVALPEGVACYTVAASLADKRSTLSDRLLGDGLVPLHSALGHHEKAQRKLLFANESHRIFYQMNHMELLSSPEVNRQMVQWLTPGRV
jgi:pimeloyl-ACP methyl ester carboxylesterase